ncbi:MAG: hypothetical protein ACYSW6_11625 [Planctomycetota bacterium]|jgi:hypothetical protein
MWTKHFTDRQIKEINFAALYTDDFHHGTDGHNAKVIIAKMSKILNAIHYAIGGPFPDIDEIKKIMKLKNEREDEKCEK